MVTDTNHSGGQSQRPETVESLLDLYLGAIEDSLRASRGLEHASLPDVMALVRNQLTQSGAFKQQLQQEFAEMPQEPEACESWMKKRTAAVSEWVRDERYVADCERLAEYKSAFCTEDRKKEIRDYFWDRTDKWALQTARARLFRRFEDRSDLRQAVDNAQHHVMNYLESNFWRGEGFDNCARSYEPAKGGIFDKFQKRKLDNLLKDALRTLKNVPEELALEREPGVADEPCGSGEVTEESRKEDLQRVLSFLQDEVRGAWELRLKAYLDLDDLSGVTLAVLSAEGRRRVHQEYVEKSCEWKQLSEHDLPKAWSKLGEKEAVEGGTRRTLLEDTWGGDLDDREALIDHLEQEARRQTLQQLEDQGRTSHQDQSTSAAAAKARAFELKKIAFMAAYKRRKKAQNALEKLLAVKAQYQNYRGSWVRSENDIARLTGMSQATVHRRMEQGRVLLLAVYAADRARRRPDQQLEEDAE